MKFEMMGEDEARIYCSGIVTDVYFTGEETCECRITTLPEKISERKIAHTAKKITKKLMRKKMMSGVEFVADADSACDIAFCGSSDLRRSRVEYMLACPVSAEREECDPGLLVTAGKEEEEDTMIVTGGDPGVFIAKLRPYGDGMYLFGVEVKEGFRHMGYGTKYMKGILCAFRDYNLHLHVSGRNSIALTLYRNLGFVTEEEIRYYTVK